MPRSTGTTTSNAASRPFNAAEFLTPDDLPGYISEALADGDHRALPIVLRTAADVLGMSELARRTGLSRETLYRTLSPTGNPRLETLTVLLEAFELRLAVLPAASTRTSKQQSPTITKTS